MLIHGQQSATSGWVRGRCRYLLLLVTALQRWLRSRSGRAEDRSTTNCRETFCLVICLSFVWMFFFPSRSKNRLGLLIECLKLTCFAREKATWFLGGEIDDRRRLLSGVLAGQRASWKRGKQVEDDVSKLKTRKKKIRKKHYRHMNSSPDEYEFDIRIRSSTGGMLDARTSACSGLTLDRSCPACSTATSPTGLSEAFL